MSALRWFEIGFDKGRDRDKLKIRKVTFVA